TSEPVPRPSGDRRSAPERRGAVLGGGVLLPEGGERPIRVRRRVGDPRLGLAHALPRRGRRRRHREQLFRALGGAARRELRAGADPGARFLHPAGRDSTALAAEDPRPHVRVIEGVLQQDEILFFASDALAAWLLRRAEKGEPAWEAIGPDAMRTKEDFEALVAQARDDGTRNDDMTLVRLMRRADWE